MAELVSLADPEAHIDQVHKKLAQVLKREREEQGLSQVALAQKAKINNSTLSLIESCQRQPTLAILLRIASALEVSLLDVLKECMEGDLPSEDLS